MFGPQASETYAGAHSQCQTDRDPSQTSQVCSASSCRSIGWCCDEPYAQSRGPALMIPGSLTLNVPTREKMKVLKLGQGDQWSSTSFPNTCMPMTAYTIQKSTSSTTIAKKDENALSNTCMCRSRSLAACYQLSKGSNHGCSSMLEAFQAKKAPPTAAYSGCIGTASLQAC